MKKKIIGKLINIEINGKMKKYKSKTMKKNNNTEIKGNNEIKLKLNKIQIVIFLLPRYDRQLVKQKYLG